VCRLIIQDAYGMNRDVTKGGKTHQSWYAINIDGTGFRHPRMLLSTNDLLSEMSVCEGVNRPYLYIGMLRVSCINSFFQHKSSFSLTPVGKPGSLFAFHVEDFWLGSLNYGHYGSSKVWWATAVSDYARVVALLKRYRRMIECSCNLFDL
jgi:hypothetical protein